MNLRSIMVEGGCCSSAPVHITCRFRHCSGHGVDHECYVRSPLHSLFTVCLCLIFWDIIIFVWSHFRKNMNWFNCEFWRCFGIDYLFLYVSWIRFLKAIDRFNDLVVSVYVTAGHILSCVLSLMICMSLLGNVWYYSPMCTSKSNLFVV